MHSASEFPPETHITVLNSNLAVPCRSDAPDALLHPAWDNADLEEQHAFTGVQAFSVPETIKLRLFDGASGPYESELRERIRQLGHGVTAYIERDDLTTHVYLNWRRTEGRPSGRRYLGWRVLGIARIPDLGVERVELDAVRVAGHQVGSNRTDSQVKLFSLPRGTLLR